MVTDVTALIVVSTERCKELPNHSCASETNITLDVNYTELYIFKELFIYLLFKYSLHPT